DDDLGLGDGGHVGPGGHAADRGLGVLLADGALADHPLEAALHGGDALVDGGLLLVDERHLVPRQRARLADARAHGAGSDDHYLHQLRSPSSSTAASSVAVTMSSTASLSWSVASMDSSPMWLLTTSMQPVLTPRSAPSVNR